MQETASKRAISVPDLPRELHNNQSQHATHTTSTVPPFYATTDAYVTEATNTDPAFLRSTFYVLPTSHYHLEECGLPFAILATPLNERAACATADALHACPECQACYTALTDIRAGRARCAICEHSAPLPSDAVVPTKPSFELRKPAGQRPVFIFVFDFSFPRVGELAVHAQALCADPLFQASYARVAFVILNRGIQLFISGAQGVQRVRILGDAPLMSSAAFIDVSDAAAIAQITAAVAAETVDMREGVVLRFLEMLTSVAREMAGVKALLISNVRNSDYAYEAFLERADNAVLSVISDSPVTDERNNIHRLAFHTGGHVTRLQRGDEARLFAAFRTEALARVAFRVAVLLKVSGTLVKSSVISPALDENLTLTRLNGLDRGDALTFVLTLNGYSPDTKHVQLQVHYTDGTGSRCTRVLNHSFETGQPAQVYAGLAPDTLFAVLAKLAAADNRSVDDAVIRALAFYRTKCSATATSSQLVLPDTLKCLPVLAQAHAKKAAASGPDALDRALVISADTEMVLRYFYPRLFSILEYAEHQSLVGTVATRLSLSKVSDSMVYLMDNGVEILIYVGAAMDAALHGLLFTTPNDGHNPPGVFVQGSLGLCAPETPEAAALHGALAEIAARYGRPVAAHVATPADSVHDARFRSYMVEDAINGLPDYVDYIFKLHFKVQSMS